MYFFIALIAYSIDMIFGEFKQIKHPIIMIGEIISGFEKRFYHDSRLRGALLVITLLLSVWCIAWLLAAFLYPVLLGVLASMFLAHHMLYESVKDAIGSSQKLAMLVSRDTENLSQSDINKALIETYAENLSDGVIAPLFYLLLFGFEGIVVYKTINTLDSMVGYKTEHYQNYGFASAKLDDLANLIPARLTALLIMILGKNYQFSKLIHFAKGHYSPNAGYPITALALTQNLQLGGSTSYHGKMMQKPYFGEGKKEIGRDDVLSALSLKRSIDIIIILGVSLGTTIFWF